MEQLMADYISSNSSLDSDSSTSETEENDHYYPLTDIRKRKRHQLNSPDLHNENTSKKSSIWKRSFPHIDGNWPSHIRLTVPVTETLKSASTEIINYASRLCCQALIPICENDESNLHISLSRPFVLQYDQIQMLIEELRLTLKWRTRISITLAMNRLSILHNDERTRSFLAVYLDEKDRKKVIPLLNCIDKCMKRNNLPIYYEDPIPHVSIASIPKDQLDKILTLEHLEDIEQNYSHHQFEISAQAVEVVIGNKKFEILLQ